jgi:hypothetical protein
MAFLYSLNPFLPNQGPTNAKKMQFARGMKWANVPDGRAMFVVVSGGSALHVNAPMGLLQQPSDRDNGSGVIRFRGNDFRRTKVPTSVRHYDYRSIDAFGNPVFSFTGK